jgi:hypothetical protein
MCQFPVMSAQFVRIGSSLFDVARLLAEDLPSWLDVDFVLNASVALAVAAGLLLVVVVFLVKSILARVLFVRVLGVAVFGLLHYHQTISDCDKSGSCECVFLGRELPGGCATGS